jgi:hypothetical protein
LLEEEMRIDSCGFLNMEGSRYLTDSKLDGSLVDIMQVTSVAPWFNDKKDMLEYLSLCVYQINSNEKLVVFTNKNQVTHNVQTKIILGLQNPPKHQNSDSTHFYTSLEELFKAGVRVTTIAYDRKNDYGSGFLEPSNGLTSLGNVFLDFCDSIGMIVDLSHAGYKTIDDILLRDEQPKKPFVATHVACQGVFRTDRNLSDEHLKKIADAGGCIGIMFLTFALDEKNNSMSTAVSHFKHAINLCGQEQNGSDRCDEDHGDRPSWTADDAFLAECEAKANEAIVVANDADYGPWGVILLPEGADEFDQDAIVMSDNISITDKYKHGEMKPCNAKFTAHARTSNPDLARATHHSLIRLQVNSTDHNHYGGTIISDFDH